VQGKQKRLTEERLPPYVSFRTWQRLLTDLSKHTPSRFDSSYFDVIKVTKSNRSMIRGALLFLDLMDSEGAPTPRLQNLVKSEGETRGSVLAEVVRHAYEPLFNDLDVSHATQAQIREYFDSQGASGDIGRKCLSFFFAVAADAHIPVSPHLTKSAPHPRARRSGPDDGSRARGSKPLEVQAEPAWERLLLEKFPNFDPEWTEDLKKKWFDAFAGLKKALEASSYYRRSPAARR